MKKLENEITKRGFDYKLVKRTDKIALYELWTRGKDVLLAGHEVFLIIIAPAKTMEIKKVIEHLPEREMFPPDSAFGVTAWSVGIDPKRALKRYNELKEQYINHQTS